MPTTGLLRFLFLKPRIFDVLTVGIQLRDVGRRRRISDAYLIDEPNYKSVQDYKAGVTQRNEITRTRRMEELLRALVLANSDLKKEKLLLVGPRDAHEIILAWLHGFSWKNITGIDLYSTNPKIRPMNMEDMTFENGTFDAIFMANTLAYAKDVHRCLSECVRVLRPGGRLAFGATYVPGGGKYPGNRHSGNEIVKMLADLPVDIYFHKPIHKINALGKPQTVHLFGVVKHDPDAPAHDRIDWKYLGSGKET